ncbi:MAG: polysaccharide deacetylase family protein, partial [Acidobacteriota bacterium]|nr:polysaccharide deacetylase family protein [Acidobacteriota bacterium]
AAVAAGAYALPAGALASAGLARALAMQTRLRDGAGAALTFDDGPHPEGTPAFLDALARHAVTATFFLTGEQVLRHPEVAREVAARGHGIGVHGHRHLLLTVRPPRATWLDLARAKAVVEDATGATPRLYRPPYGVANAAALVAARRLGLRVVLWTRWGRDWEASATAASVASTLTRGLRGGEILLLHDADHYASRGSWRATLAALPAIAAAVDGAGLGFVGIT